jgi:hypothetical protein
LPLSFEQFPPSARARGVGSIPIDKALLNVTLCIDPSLTCVDFILAVAPLLSMAVGVGSRPWAAAVKFIIPTPVLSLRACIVSILSVLSCALGVGNKPNPLSSVGSVFATSWNQKREDFVPFSFQVRLHLVEYQSPVPINKPANVFAHDPTWLNLSNCSKHFWPEVAFILFTEAFTGG